MNAGTSVEKYFLTSRRNIRHNNVGFFGVKDNLTEIS